MAVEWDWTTAEFGEAHAGQVRVLVEDGSEPGPVYFDIGSGSEMHSTTHWTAYDGRYGRPRARTLRAACACGWRSVADYPLDWEGLGEEPLYEADVDLSGPLADWTAHLTVVREDTVELPEPLAAVLVQLAERLQDAAAETPLAALRAVGMVERITHHLAQEAADAVWESGTPAEELAAALGTTPSKALGMLLRHRSS
jgi:hypothetical protein